MDMVQACVDMVQACMEMVGSESVLLRVYTILSCPPTPYTLLQTCRQSHTHRRNGRSADTHGGAWDKKDHGRRVGVEARGMVWH